MHSETETQKPAFETLEDARQYVDQARQLYREEKASYAGRRTEEQQMVAEVSSEEGRYIADGAMIALMALGGVLKGQTNPTAQERIPEDYETRYEAGGFTWKEFRSAFGQLMASFSVMTNRLEREGYIRTSYANFHEPDRLKIASVLFGDFLEHNALRFGVEGAGLPRLDVRRIHNDEGGITTIREEIRDKDLAKDDREIRRNMSVRGYSSEGSTHPAGKISPADYKRIRRERPEEDKDRFDFDVSFLTDIESTYENRE